MLEVKKFGAIWCHGCTLFKDTVWPRLIDKYAQTGIAFIDVDIDNNPQMAQEFRILSLPTTVFIKDGIEAYRIVGIQLLKAYEDAIERLK